MTVVGLPCVNLNNGSHSYLTIQADFGTFSPDSQVQAVFDTVTIKNQRISFMHLTEYAGINFMLPIRLTGQGLPALPAAVKKALAVGTPLTGLLTITVINPPSTTATAYAVPVIYVNDDETVADEPDHP
jgi:hypothetical protein